MPIDVTPLGTIKSENTPQFRNAKQASLELAVVDEQPYELAIAGDGNVTSVSLLHPWNTCSPIDVTVLGTATEVREVQLLNALLPIDATLLGIVTDVRELQPKKA